MLPALDLTNGSISGHLIKITGLTLVTRVFQTLHFIVDLYWVSRLGKETVAGVGIAGNLLFIVFAIAQMLAVGTTTLISHSAGRKERAQAELVIIQLLLLTIIVAAAFCAVMTGAAGVYVTALSSDKLSRIAATSYLQWSIPAMALQLPMIVLGAALRGAGNVRPGMVVQTASVILNIILTPILMFGWVTAYPMGVAGAGLGSFLAALIGTVWLTVIYLDGKSFLELRRDIKPRGEIWRQGLKIGFPSGVEFALIGLHLFVVYRVISPFGAAAQAAFGIGHRLMQIGFIPVAALGFAVAPVAGQNFGARRPDRVRETISRAIVIATIVMFLFTLACQLAADTIVSFFSSDRTVIIVGAEYLRIVSWSAIASGIVCISGSVFQAVGNTIPSLLASITRLIAIAVPVIILASLSGFQLRWIWWLTVIGALLQLIVSLALLRRELRVRL